MTVLMGQCPGEDALGLAIQTGIGYNTIMAMLQLIIVAALVSVLYVYLRLSN